MDVLERADSSRLNISPLRDPDRAVSPHPHSRGLALDLRTPPRPWRHFYLGSGNPSYASPIPNVLFHNNGGHSFTDVTASSGTGVLPKAHGIAFADLDNDGDEDIFVVMGGAVPGDHQTARLFDNQGNGNNWITVRLEGQKSNRAAVVARIKVAVNAGDAGARSIYRTVSSGGSFWGLSS